MTHVLPGQLSCPNCGARTTANVEACARCGCRFVEDLSAGAHARAPIGPGRRGAVAVALAAGAVAAVGAAVLVATRGAREEGEGGLEGAGGVTDRPRSDVLSNHPLAARAAERRLEARFTPLRDDDSAAARCFALEPRPAHAIRRCRIRYPGGSERTVIVLTNPQGRELLIEP